jgi:predicted butyrate kinase (DUF1464 family)
LHLAFPDGAQMPRVIGIDPGTVSIDICGLEDGRLFFEQSLPTRDALHDPHAFAARLQEAGTLDLIVGPSGYGLPCIRAAAAGEEDLRLAFLAAEGEAGGIGGLRTLVRTLASCGLPVMLTPGVIHLASVPRHRKVNRVDMGTADKVCAVALAVREQAWRRRCALDGTAFILLELGGAFTAAIAVQRGRIVDGLGGSSGPIGLRAAGALDGEVAFLAAQISKSLIFTGGIASLTGNADPDASGPVTGVAREAYLEGAIKGVACVRVSAPEATEVILSGRVAQSGALREELRRRLLRLDGVSSVEFLRAPGESSMQAAYGAALMADGLAGGAEAPLVEHLGIREAGGSVLDHLHVISREQARRTLGIAH